jgi:2-polyprenyl-3-methyl-5-hydroxy-6-metoxy-1,4-benzoquinol methylase
MINCDICNSEAQLLWRVNKIDILKCKHCGLIFADVDNIPIYNEDYYKTVYPDYERDIVIHRKNNEMLLNCIERWFSVGRLLEVGSAFGFFVQCAKRRGWDAMGLEISQYSSNIATQKYKCRVENEDFLEKQFHYGFDLVCMIDTIEHLSKPSLYIEKVARTVKYGGG